MKRRLVLCVLLYEIRIPIRSCKSSDIVLCIYQPPFPDVIVP
jgi:hypothetical protein